MLDNLTTFKVFIKLEKGGKIQILDQVLLTAKRIPTQIQALLRQKMAGKIQKGVCSKQAWIFQYKFQVFAVVLVQISAGERQLSSTVEKYYWLAAHQMHFNKDAVSLTDFLP